MAREQVSASRGVPGGGGRSGPPLGACPLLVGLPAAGPDTDLGAVAGPGAERFEAELGMDDAGDGAVVLQLPGLIGRTGAVGDDRRAPRAGPVTADGQARLAVDGQLLVGSPAPGLVAATVAVPQVESGAGGRRKAGHVETPVAGRDAQRVAGRCGRQVAGRLGLDEAPAPLQLRETTLVGDREGGAVRSELGQ